MIPQIIELGPVPIHSFGCMLVLAIFAAWLRLELNMRSLGLDPDLAEKSIFWAAFWGIVGARLLYLVRAFDELLADPISVLFSSAGFVFHGSIVGGAIAVYVIGKKRGIPFFRFLDLSAAPLAIGYGVGRIGCHLSGDGDYGIVTSLPWAFQYHLGVVPTLPGVAVHPTPIYETLVSLALAFFLVYLQRRGAFDRIGLLFGVYLILSSVSRFAVEFIRVEPVVRWGLTEAQLFSMVLLVAGALMALMSRRQKEPAAEG